MSDRDVDDISLAGFEDKLTGRVLMISSVIGASLVRLVCRNPILPTNRR
jgi:hypothetical protein